MKPSIYRRIRRRSASHEPDNIKKENKQEQSFFGDAAHETFFQPTPVIQRKCDECEKEDKKVQRQADKKEEEKVMRAGDKNEPIFGKAREDKEEKIQKKEDKKEEDKLMKKEVEKEEDKLQMKAASSPSAPSASASNYVSSLNGKGNQLTASANQFFSSKMGYDFSDVKVHTDKEAAQSAKNINAKAYTVGNNIVFNEGQFDPASLDGKKLMAHELAHVMQQEKNENISRKGEEETGQECTAGSVNLEALTDAKYKKGAGTAKNEVTKKSKGCDGCEDDSCVSITGSLKVPYSVATKINLPVVPANLSPCQQDRVRVAINTTLMAHEKKHVKAFESFNGTASLPISYQGCAENYVSYQEGLSENEFQRRQAGADAKSAALDPFSVPVDLCCKDKPKK